MPPCAPFGSVLALSRRRRRTSCPFSGLPRPLARVARARVAPACRLAACNAPILHDSRAVASFIDFDHKTRICPLVGGLATCCAPSVRVALRATCLRRECVPVRAPCLRVRCACALSLRCVRICAPPRRRQRSPLRAFGDGERTAPRLRVAPFIARGMGACPLSAFARVFTGQYIVP